MNPLFSIEHLSLLLGGLLLLGGFLAWRSAAKASRSLRWRILVLRALALAGLCVIAINPGKWKENREDIASEWVVLVDHTRSMAAQDVGGVSRRDEARRLAGKLLAMSDDDARAKLYRFDSELSSDTLKDLEKRELAEGNTDIVGAGKALLSRYRGGGRRLSGVVLLSDGRQVAGGRGSELSMIARSQECPFYVLPLGGEVLRKDLVLESGRKQYVSFAGQELKVQVILRNEDMGRISPTLSLRDQDGNVVAKKQVESAPGDATTVSFAIEPSAKGYFEYSVRVEPWEGESTTANNEISFGIAALSSRIRVLLIEGIPHWDSKFVAQLLRKQPNMEVTGVYRVSRERFFRVESDASEVHGESISIFPDDLETLSEYDLVLFGRGAEYFLTSERIGLLRQFVREQGGSILFARGKPYTGELAELGALEPVAWGETVSSPLNLLPTETGQEVGLFGDSLPGRDDPVWGKLPALERAYSCSRLKGFSQVLLEGSMPVGGRDVSIPVIVSCRYGKGMVVVVNGEGLWKWDFFPTVKEANALYQGLWPQLVEWVMTYSDFLPGHSYALRLSQKSVMPGVPVRARVSRRGRKSDETPRQSIRVYSGEAQVQELALAESGRDRWDSIFSLKEPGNYRIELVDGATGESRGPCSVLRVLPSPAESDDFSADRDFLAELAENSGGRIVQETGFDELIKVLEPEKESVDLNKAVWDPAWDQWWVLSLIALGFGYECFLRRRNGLM